MTEQAARGTARGAAASAGRHEFTVEADARKLERMRKEGHVRGFTVYCDEGENAGGDNSAPNPLGYFLLGVAF
ncbi:MAG TPA: hypothetical protein VK066_23140 [Chloroflexota bacterium]|nr:hypothetical protein [Chloroflexota bacterium]